MNDNLHRSATFLTLLRIPPGLRWYSVADQVVYPMHSPNGGFSANLMAVLVKELHPDFPGDFGDAGLHVVASGKWYVVHFPWSEDFDATRERMAVAVDALEFA